MRWFAALLIVGALGFAGCDKLLPLAITQRKDLSAADLPLKQDRAADAPADTAIMMPDRAADGPAVNRDRAADRPKPDRAAESAVLKVDRAPEGSVTKPDLAPDALIKNDAPPDATIKADKIAASDFPVGACAGSAQPVQAYSASMVRCWQASGKTQCQAKNLCGSNWHLCKASEFVAAGGLTQVSTGQGWLASCVRDGANMQAPTETPCSSCTAGNANLDEYYLWDCAGGALVSAPYDYLGVYATGEQYRVGSSTSPCAFWSAGVSSASLQGAMCCAGP